MFLFFLIFFFVLAHLAKRYWSELVVYLGIYHFSLQLKKITLANGPNLAEIYVPRVGEIHLYRNQIDPLYCKGMVLPKVIFLSVRLSVSSTTDNYMLVSLILSWSPLRFIILANTQTACENIWCISELYLVIIVFLWKKSLIQTWIICFQIYYHCVFDLRNLVLCLTREFIDYRIMRKLHRKTTFNSAFVVLYKSQ